MADFSKILAIDDNTQFLEELSEYLEDSGFIVLTAEDGIKGLEYYHEQNPDVILVDLQVPGISGLQVLETIVKNSPDRPVIMCSNASVVDDAVESLRLGAWDYIVKPVKDMAVVEHAICKSLERARLVQENITYRRELEQTNTQLSESLRELEEDQKAGRHVQRQILPEELFKHKRYTFQHRILPSLYLSGDFVDYFQINPSFLAFYIADVSGHGASSAFVTVLLKSMVSQFLSQYRMGQSSLILHPSELLKKISDEVIKIKLGKYLTMVFGIIDMEQNQLCYSIGGHYPSPILSDGEKVEFLKGSGFAVGIHEKATFEDHIIQLPDRFSLYMFSDGILEKLEKNSLDIQEQVLLDGLKDLQTDPDAILKKFHVEAGKSLPDDIALFMVNRGG